MWMYLKWGIEGVFWRVEGDFGVWMCLVLCLFVEVYVWGVVYYDDYFNG